MRVLFFLNPHEDYLADAVFHGFRKLYGSDCVDYPKCEVLYKNCPDIIKKQVRGNGFSLYSGLLEDIEVDRYNITEKIQSGYFDLIIFSNIQRLYGLFTQYRPWLRTTNTVVLDGEDTNHTYPARGFWWRRPYYWFLPKAHHDFLYFKRELTYDTYFNFSSYLIPAGIRKMLPLTANLRKISFCFPEEKIIRYLPEKKKDFTKHIVDKEVSELIPGSSTSYAFDSEESYYDDIQKSRYGITTKRAGWDCLRHYEIAANGTVPCFKNLQSKPATCAPHGLSEKNTIFYTDAKDLMDKIGAVNETEYALLQKGAMEWVIDQTTTKRAMQIIAEHDIVVK